VILQQHAQETEFAHLMGHATVMMIFCYPIALDVAQTIMVLAVINVCRGV
jgi:hypothetical protein